MIAIEEGPSTELPDSTGKTAGPAAAKERRFSFGVSYLIIKRSGSPGEPPGGKEAGMSVKVLLIDDDQDFRVSVRSLLETRGYEVLDAGSGHEGLRLVLEHKPDVILLDIMMETSVEGYGVTHALKFQDEYAEHSHVPIFMLSSVEESPDERFPMSEEVEMIRPDAYLTKPLDIPRFLALLEKAVGGAGRVP
jgi:CheY-like chemotaxis protein